MARVSGNEVPTGAYPPMPTGTPTVGQIPVVTAASPLALGWTSPTAPIDAVLGADVAMTNSNQFYDGPSASFAAGTWMVWYKAIIRPSAASNTHDYTVRLWDGTNIYDETDNSTPAAATVTTGVEVFGVAVVVLASTTTLKVSAADIRTGCTLARDVFNNSGASHTATRLSAVKIA